MAQQSSTANQQETQTNIYPNANQIASWQNIDATAGGLAQWWINNQGPQATVAAPTDLANEYWNQVANNAGVPDVSGTQSQLQNVGQQMGQQMAPTSYNFQPGQATWNNPFANGVPQVSPGTGVSGLASSYQYSPTQVSGPTVSATQVQAPGAVTPISGIQQIQAPQLQQYQMGPAQQVAAPTLQNYQMQAAAPISAQQVSGPQSWTNPGTAAQYMSPYTQNVVDTQLAQAQVQEQQQLQQQKGQAAQAGAFGGSREAVEEANTSIGYQQMAAGLEAQGLQSAYQQGMGQFTTEQQMGQQAQFANQQTGLAAAQANQQAEQQARMQNLAAQQQTQALGATTSLQAQGMNQGAGLTVGQANLAANQQTQALGVGALMQAQTANQAMDYQTKIANQQAQEFGYGQQMTAGLANQQANLTAAEATAGYNMQGQVANQMANAQANQFATGLGFQGATFNAGQQMQSGIANQAAGMQAMGMEYGGNEAAAMQTQNLGYMGQVQGAQMGLQGTQLNLANLGQQGNLAVQGGNLGLGAYAEGLQGMTQLGNAMASNQGYQQQVADTAYQNQMNNMMLPFQALNFQTGVMAQNPSWGQTTTSDNYQQGQTDAPQFNWGQLAGAGIAAAGQVFKGAGTAALARKGGLMRFADGGIAAAAPASPYDKAVRRIGNADAYSRYTRAPIHISNPDKSSAEMLKSLKGMGINAYFEGDAPSGKTEPSTGRYEDGIHVDLSGNDPTYKDFAKTLTHEDIHALLERAGITKPDIPSQPYHQNFWGIEDRDPRLQARLAMQAGDRAGDYTVEAPAYVGAYDPAEMPGFTQADRDAWLAKFLPTLPPGVADTYRRMLHGYQAGQGFAEGGLASIMPRRRMYAPMKRHNYPMVRRHPEEIGMHPDASTGLGGFAYA